MTTLHSMSDFRTLFVSIRLTRITSLMDHLDSLLLYGNLITDDCLLGHCGKPSWGDNRDLVINEVPYHMIDEVERNLDRRSWTQQLFNKVNMLVFRRAFTGLLPVLVQPTYRGKRCHFMSTADY